MIKGKTLLKLLSCLIITFLISNNTYARLIKPEPKPSEYKKDRNSSKRQKTCTKGNT